MEELVLIDKYGRELEVDSLFDNRDLLHVSIDSPDIGLALVCIDRKQLKALYYHIQQLLIEG